MTRLAFRHTLCYSVVMVKEPAVTIVADAGGKVQNVYVSVEPLPGQPCPTCGRSVPMTGAQRQAKYRAKERDG